MPFDPLTFFASVGTGLMNTGINQAIGNYNYKRHREDAIKDRDYNNFYNSPKEQMKRLKEAGLNPNLVYGNGAGTAVTPADNTASTTAENAPAEDNYIKNMIAMRESAANVRLMNEKAREMQRTNDWWELQPEQYGSYMRSIVSRSEREALGMIPEAEYGRSYFNQMHSDDDAIRTTFNNALNSAIIADINSSVTSDQLRKKQIEYTDTNIKNISQEIQHALEKHPYIMNELKLNDSINEAKQKVIDYLNEQVEPLMNKMPDWLKNSIVIGTLSAMFAAKARQSYKAGNHGKAKAELEKSKEIKEKRIEKKDKMIIKSNREKAKYYKEKRTKELYDKRQY